MKPPFFFGLLIASTFVLAACGGGVDMNSPKTNEQPDALKESIVVKRNSSVTVPVGAQAIFPNSTDKVAIISNEMVPAGTRIFWSASVANGASFVTIVGE